MIIKLLNKMFLKKFFFKHTILSGGTAVSQPSSILAGEHCQTTLYRKQLESFSRLCNFAMETWAEFSPLNTHLKA